MCHFFCSQDHWCVPSEGDKDYLTLRCTKPVPTQLFLECLVHLKVPFLRLTDFGQKEKIDKFVTIKEEIASCTAETSGYPQLLGRILQQKSPIYFCYHRGTSLPPSCQPPARQVRAVQALRRSSCPDFQSRGQHYNQLFQHRGHKTGKGL